MLGTAVLPITDAGIKKQVLRHVTYDGEAEELRGAQHK
jgi:hypothetical protein